MFLYTCSIIIFVSFWAESSLHNAITGEASKIISFTNSSFIEDTAGSAAVDIVETVVLFIEAKRYVQCMYILVYHVLWVEYSYQVFSSWQMQYVAGSLTIYPKFFWGKLMLCSKSNRVVRWM